LISYIYRNPHKAQFKKGSKVNIDWTPQDKEDLFQEICYHFYNLLDEFDPDISELQGLMKGKLHLRVYDNFFEDVADRKINELAFDEDIDIEQKTKDILYNEEVRKSTPQDHIELYMALNQLSQKQRNVLELSIVKGWNATEIAKELDIKPAGVRKTKERALTRLKEIMITEEETI
jgi:RNA polymerase sigma factor (sigma-70 family)